MNVRKLSFVVAASCSLTACVHMQAIVEKTTASPDPASGYVGGRFVTSGGAFTYGFAIVDAVGRQWVLPFADPAGNGSKYIDGKMVGFIALPPGDYRIGSWVKSNMDTKGKEIPATDLVGRPFTVKPGHVVFLGSFRAERTVTVSGTTTYTHFSIQPLDVRADEVWTAVTQEYPGFTGAPIECVLCSAPPDDASKFAMPVPRDARDFSSAHHVVVHVYRSDRQYASALVTAWETTDGSKDQREVVGASWNAPLKPARTDTFGAVFVLNDLNFKNGRVNFAVRDPNRTQPPIERAFALGDAREVWVNDGDPKVYLSEKDALAAQRD